MSTGCDPAAAAGTAAPAAAAPPAAVDRLASILPPQLLQDGEAVLLLRKPSRWYILLAPLGFFVLVLALAAAGHRADAFLNQARMSGEILTLAATLLLLRLGWQTLDWAGRVYVLTDRRVLRVQGVIRVSVFEARLSRLQHTGLFFSLRERLFGLGTVTFSTAGTGTVEAAWLFLHEPLEVHRLVLETQRRCGGGAAGGNTR
ncbi:PH domain-containing protein [Phycisphaera mikurensis]|uniref:YdbS-like PH domain-containing protein n=1 Tax=Phycisphaera mikurensis (strain NBRC 102666 / KCTC 22515 / FYK2301M01) TaxID=1142394 RepID=I0IFK1_PHYMF|nr:PH domain-containing protein [Phycisphaera mikurensis]MBB6440569.1 hypothetical protein [Phycisphaera mikurensis]BAM04039.1 hypothetical protein PSMK_18800 [Phycisphaera mikurensis NBRC 102666]